MKTLICDCNKTMPLDAPALSRALAQTALGQTDGLETTYTGLCRREAGAFQRAAIETARSGDELLVACTQEQRLFLELNAATEGAARVEERPIRFVNIRETGGWSRDAAQATPKLAALIAAAQLPAPQPVATVSYQSNGRCLILGSADATRHAASLLGDKLELSLLIDRPGGQVEQAHEHAVHHGRLVNISGWLGQFQVEWAQDNPIDLDLCTRCNACVAACPEGAIGADFRIDMAACKSHRDCVRVCEAAGAIDFARSPQSTTEQFDLVLDLRETPAFGQHQPPQGYQHVPPGAASALIKAVLSLREQTGSFEKPRFFNYNAKICAHSRNEQLGCTACIDVCSAQAIRSDASRKGKPGLKTSRHVVAAAGGARPPVTPVGGGIIVEPYLCVGCGACTTVCPTGALSFAYPGPVDQGQRLRSLLTTYAQAGGKNAALLLHNEGSGAAFIQALGRAARSTNAGTGLAAKLKASKVTTAANAANAANAAAHPALHGVPARVLPVALWHAASTGLDLWLSALAQGANQIWVLLTKDDAPQYRQALKEQMAVAQALLHGLGFAGQHLALIELEDTPQVEKEGDAAAQATALQRALQQLDAALRAAPAQGVAQAATFATQADKRSSLDAALAHLMAQSPLAAQRPDTITLPAAGSPWGSLVVDASRCTLCLSCVGACPASALADNPEKPQLKFTEKNCVQCGLCASTCPEDAIRLQPRLWLADDGKARKAARVLHETEPYRCVRCSAPFGTLRAIENMVGKLAGHSAFQGAAAERLKMCGDCRVLDIHSNPAEVRITDL